MDLRFVAPDLRKLDLLVCEVLAVPVFQGERPPRGCAGLLDYRMAGKLSATIVQGHLTGTLGEKVLLRGRPKVPFDKLLLFGAGDPEKFNLQVFASLVDLLLLALSDLGMRRAVVELPGREHSSLSPEMRAEVLLSRAGTNPLFDTWTLIETAEAARAIRTLLVRDRRGEWQP